MMTQHFLEFTKKKKYIYIYSFQNQHLVIARKISRLYDQNQLYITLMFLYQPLCVRLFEEFNQFMVQKLSTTIVACRKQKISYII